MKLSYDDPEFLEAMLAFCNEYNPTINYRRVFNYKYNVEISEDFFKKSIRTIPKAYSLVDVNGEYEEGEGVYSFEYFFFYDGLGQCLHTISRAMRLAEAEKKNQDLRESLGFSETDEASPAAPPSYILGL